MKIRVASASALALFVLAPAVPAFAYTIEGGAAAIPDNAPVAEEKPSFDGQLNLDPEFSVFKSATETATAGLPHDEIQRPTIIPGVPTPEPLNGGDVRAKVETSSVSSQKDLLEAIGAIFSGILPVPLA